MSPGGARKDSLRRLCATQAAAQGFVLDAAQLAAVDKLEALRARLIRSDAQTSALTSRLLGGLTRRRTAAVQRGVYLYGAVGRGKTWLMDQFCQSLPLERRLRTHFHRFMRDVHAGLEALKPQSDPLKLVAADLARRARVICFDELFVSDIADAMILGALFQHLFDAGVVLVITSNVPPALLYKDGLQRARFLPAIALLEKYTEVLSVDGGSDYRLRQLTQAAIYVDSKAPSAEQRLLALFEDLADGPGIEGGTIKVANRKISFRHESENVIWFDFSAICEGPRSQNDYIEIACEYQSVIVGNVPVMGTREDNAARRFIALVDEFYDRAVNLVLSAAAPPDMLYQGEKLRFEFQRTISRLAEMQTTAYLARQHRA